jgi:hypothetical protein
MPAIYVRSTDGDNADNGSTWALAKATLAGADGIDAAGDIIYVSQSHSESTASAVSLGFAGTLATPTYLICGDDAAAPPTTPSSAGNVATTGANSITITSKALVEEGINWLVGSAANSASFLYAQDAGIFHKKGGSIVLNNSNTASKIFFGLGTGNNESRVTLENVGFKFGSAGQYVQMANTQIEILGGSVLSGGTSPTSVFYAIGGIEGKATGLDLSNVSTTATLFVAGIGAVGKFVFRGLKLPASWTGTIFSSGGAPANPGFRVELHDYMAGTSKLQLWAADYQGNVKSEATLVRTGGASDGTSAFSWQMVTNANPEFPHMALETPEIPPKWNATTGASKTVTVEILHDSLTALNDDEVWIDVWYRGTASSSAQTLISDRRASILSSAAAQTTSSETWTTTGMTNPNKQKLSVTFTPEHAGFIQARVCLAKASKTIYVDPVITVT